MSGSSLPAVRAAPGTVSMVLPAWPCGLPAGSRPAGTMAQLAGQGACLVATPKRRVFPGRPEQVALARRFVARMLDGCPVADDAQLCASELASNAIRHTVRPGAPRCGSGWTGSRLGNRALTEG